MFERAILGAWSSGFFSGSI